MFEYIKEFESIPGKIRDICTIMESDREGFSEGFDLDLTTELSLNFFFDRAGDIRVRIIDGQNTRIGTVNDAVTIVLEMYLLTRDGLNHLADDVIDYGLSREFRLSKTRILTIIPHGKEADIVFKEA